MRHFMVFCPVASHRPLFILAVAIVVAIVASTPCLRAQTTGWTQYGSGPVLDLGPAGSWDDGSVFMPCVLKDRDTLKMWYTGADNLLNSANLSVGYAWSTDGISWTRHMGNPVLPKSTSGWENGHTISAGVIKDGDTLKMWYAGMPSGVATIPGPNQKVGYSTSIDGIHWTRLASPVLQAGATGEWDHDIFAPGNVIKDGATYKMWYSGGTGSFYGTHTMSIGYATSTDGITWTKYNDPATTSAPYQYSDPVLQHGVSGYDVRRAWNCWVMKTNAGYEMWYTAASSGPQAIAYATSPDGIHWTKSPALALQGSGWAGTPDGIISPSIVRNGSQYCMWFSAFITTIQAKIGYATAPVISETIICVPQDQPSIQAGIDAASNGDTVLVTEGIYLENILITKKITVGSLYLIDGDTSHISRTVIDGSTPRHPDSAAVVTFNANADTTSTLMGFTIRGGKGNLHGRSNRYGGGIDVIAGGAAIVRNRVTGNTVQGMIAGGGGIAAFGPARILGNIVTNNKANSDGGGVLVSGSAAKVYLSNNIIAGNESSYEGGGLHATAGAQATLVNNSIVYNASKGVEGVNVTPFAPATVRMINNICWNPGIGADICFVGLSRASHNLIRSSYYGENINVDPGFAERSTYSLASNSPCISKGIPSDTIDGMAIVAPSTDIYGNPRPNLPSGNPDLGAVESPVETSTPFFQNPQMTHHSINVQGTARYYSLFRPKNYDSADKLPVLLAFVGAGTGVSQIHEFALGMGLQNIADSVGFMLVSPQPPGDSWGDGASDLTFISDLLDTLIRYYKVDSQRVYLTGLSSGALMSFVMACHLSSRICAIAPVAGTLPSGVAQTNPPTNAVAMVLFIGTADASYSGTEWTIGKWLEFNHCTAISQSETLPDLDPNDGTTVTKITYNDYNPIYGKPVWFYRINGGNHNWPGLPHPYAQSPQTKDIFASAEMFKFFTATDFKRLPEVSKDSIRHVTGKADATMRVFAVDSIKASSHRGDQYRVTFTDSAYATSRMSVFNLTRNVPVANGLPVPRNGADVLLDSDGLRLQFSLTKPTFSADSSRWRAGTSNLQGMAFIPPGGYALSDGSVVKSNAYPADYLIAFSDQVIDTSVAALEAPSVPVKFTVKNLTEDRRVPVVFVDPDGNGQLGVNENIVVLEKSWSGSPEPMVSWEITFHADATPILPQAGDSYLVRILKPFGAGDTATFTLVWTGIAERLGSRVPEQYSLSQNYPNPFNPVTRIRFDVPSAKDVRLAVYDILGREVVVLVNEKKQPGTYETMFDGSRLASGVYFYRLQAGSFVDTKKLLLIR